MQGHIHGLGNVVSSTAESTNVDAVSSVLDGSSPLPTARMFTHDGPKNGAADS